MIVDLTITVPDDKLTFVNSILTDLEIETGTPAQRIKKYLIFCIRRDAINKKQRLEEAEARAELATFIADWNIT